MISLFILVILLAALISFGLTPLTIRFFVKNNWIEDPQEKHKKTNNATALWAVPRGGGLPVFAAVFIIAFLFLPPDKHLIGIFLASLITLVVGLIDDVYDISPKVRLITNTLSALMVVASGIGIAYLSNPLGGVIDLSLWQFSFDLFGRHSVWILSDILALIWIVWSMNVVGWANGVEGQLPGYVSISAIFIGILGLKYSGDITQWPVIILAGAVAGAYLGFLPFNFYPQKIMPGYSGKSLAGFLLAVLAILSGAKLATVIFLLGVPMLDAVFVLTWRLIEGKPVYIGDNKHLHHRLLQMGWSRPRIAVTYWLFSFILGMISLFLNSQQKFYTFIGLGLIFFWLAFSLSRRTGN